jgi:hypothetical protein
MAVITISRQFGSGGDEIAHCVASALGYDLINKEQIVEAARLARRGVESVVPTNVFHFLTAWYMEQVEPFVVPSLHSGQALSPRRSRSGDKLCGIPTHRSGVSSFLPTELCYYELPDKLFENHSVYNDLKAE